MPRYSTTVKTLLASSLALPGMDELLAGEAPEDSVDYRYTRYDEAPIPSNRLAFGDPRRYEIDSHQFRVVRNLDDSYSLEIGVLHEAMSGSSPWYAMPGPDGPLQVMSGATIREERTEIQATLGWNGENRAHRGTIGYSTENDYVARFGVYSGEYERSGGQTIGWSVSYSDDIVEPTDAALYGRIERADRDSVSVSGSFTQTLNRNALLQAGVSATRQSGFLSDPYKLVWIDEAVVYDNRPDERLSFTLNGRFRQYMEQSGAALALDYRYFRDDWGIASHTVTAAWRQPLGDGWELSPSVRYYTQSAPGFYAPYFLEAPTSGYRSSDYRLSGFGALSFRLHTYWRRDKWSLSAGVEYYDSEESFALSGSSRNTPGLVDFWRMTAGFSITL